MRFLNDVGGGEIARIVDERTVSVLNEDGFEVPTLVKEIIVVDSSSDQKIGSHSSNDEPLAFNKSNLQEPKTETKTDISERESFFSSYTGIDDIKDEDGEDIGLHMAFVPKDQLNSVESDQDLYLINDSTYRIVYIVGGWNKERNAIEPIHSGFLPPDSKERIKEFEKKELNTPIAFNIQALFFKNTSYIDQQP